MKTPILIIIILVFNVLAVFAQSAQESIEKIKRDLSTIDTPQQAEEYLKKNPSLTGELFELNSRTDTTQFDRELMAIETGSLVDYGSEDKQKHFFFKPLQTTPFTSYRVQYIYLDNRKLTLTQIDSLRKVITMRIDKGESFGTLAKEYSMDNNAKNNGDLGWFDEGMMRSEFEEKIKRNKTGSVFTVDIPSEKWYYVVRKSHDPKMNKKVTALYVEINVGK